MNCDDIRDDIDLCVVGTLPAAEDERVRMHAATCPDCGPLLLSGEAVAARLGQSVPLVPAPASLRASLMTAVHAESRQDSSAPAPSAPPPARSRGRGRVARYGAAAAVLVLLPMAGLALWVAQLQRDVNTLRAGSEVIQRRSDGLLMLAMPSSLKSDFQSLGDIKGAVGAASWNQERQVCAVVLDNLPPPESGASYRLWYIIDGQRVIDAGAVTLDDGGKAQMMIDASRWRGQEYEMLVTLERQPHDRSAPAVLTARLRRP